MTTEAANLELSRVSRSEQYSSGGGGGGGGGGYGLHLPQSETHLQGKRERQKYCRRPIGSIFFHKFLTSAFKSRASLIHLNN